MQKVSPQRSSLRCLRRPYRHAGRSLGHLLRVWFGLGVPAVFCWPARPYRQAGASSQLGFREPEHSFRAVCCHLRLPPEVTNLPPPPLLQSCQEAKPSGTPYWQLGCRPAPPAPPPPPSPPPPAPGTWVNPLKIRTIPFTSKLIRVGSHAYGHRTCMHHAQACMPCSAMHVRDKATGSTVAAPLAREQGCCLPPDRWCNGRHRLLCVSTAELHHGRGALAVFLFNTPPS